MGQTVWAFGCLLYFNVSLELPDPKIPVLSAECLSKKSLVSIVCIVMLSISLSRHDLHSEHARDLLSIERLKFTILIWPLDCGHNGLKISPDWL